MCYGQGNRVLLRWELLLPISPFQHPQNSWMFADDNLSPSGMLKLHGKYQSLSSLALKVNCMNINFFLNLLSQSKICKCKFIPLFFSQAQGRTFFLLSRICSGYLNPKQRNNSRSSLCCNGFSLSSSWVSNTFWPKAELVCLNSGRSVMQKC